MQSMLAPPLTPRESAQRGSQASMNSLPSSGFDFVSNLNTGWPDSQSLVPIFELLALPPDRYMCKVLNICFTKSCDIIIRLPFCKESTEWYSQHIPVRRRSEDVDYLLPFLQRLHTLRSLPKIAQRALCVAVDAISIQQGENVYRKGDTSDAAYVVLSGSVHLIIPGDPARHPTDIELGVMLRGQGFGDVALIDKEKPRTSDAIALDSACILLRLRISDYDLITNALQTEELIRSAQIPPQLRSEAEVKLVKRIVCDHLNFFSKFPDAMRLEFARAFNIMCTTAPGEPLFQAKTPAKAMYICLSCVVESVQGAFVWRTSSIESLTTVAALQGKAGPHLQKGFFFYILQR